MIVCFSLYNFGNKCLPLSLLLSMWTKDNIGDIISPCFTQFSSLKAFEKTSFHVVHISLSNSLEASSIQIYAFVSLLFSSLQSPPTVVHMFSEGSGLKANWRLLADNLSLCLLITSLLLLLLLLLSSLWLLFNILWIAFATYQRFFGGLTDLN